MSGLLAVALFQTAVPVALHRLFSYYYMVTADELPSKRTPRLQPAAAAPTCPTQQRRDGMTTA